MEILDQHLKLMRSVMVGKVAVGSKTYSGFCEDFVTVNPYLEAMESGPFMEVCKEEKKGMFILVKTSNPSSGEFQDQEIDGKPLYEMVAEKVAPWGRRTDGRFLQLGIRCRCWSNLSPKMGEVLRKIMPKIIHLSSRIRSTGWSGKGSCAIL